MEAQVRHALGENLRRAVVGVVEGRTPHEPDQHRGDQGAVHLPEDPGLGAALEHPGQSFGDALPAGLDDLLLPQEEPRLALLHQPEEGRWRANVSTIASIMRPSAIGGGSPRPRRGPAGG